MIEALGQNGVITAAKDMEKYLDDPLAMKSIAPIAILRPKCTKEVQIAVQWARENDYVIIPQGGLTGLTSAAVPAQNQNAVILSLDRMNAIRKLNALDQTLEVEAGAVLGDVRKFVQDEGFYFPLFHGAQGSSQIGGNLSTNSGGNNALRYGTARDQVLGLEVVLANGEVWDGLRRLRKNTAGYDLRQLFIGSEGTLGIITAAVLKLRLMPNCRATAFVALSSPDEALKLLSKLSRDLGETVSAFELISEPAYDIGIDAQNLRRPLEDKAPWYALVEAETPSEDFQLQEIIERSLGEALESELILDAAIAQNVSQRDALWQIRESIPARFVEDKSTLKMDTAVPVDAIPEFLVKATKAVEDKMPGIRATPFGHLGDGNIHFNMLRPKTMDGHEFRRHWEEITQVVCDVALELGGTISAEHGIGRLKRAEFLETVDSVSLHLMKAMKTAIDPDNRLNPGVLF